MSIDEIPEMEMDADECLAGSCADNPRICGPTAPAISTALGIREAVAPAEDSDITESTSGPFIGS